MNELATGLLLRYMTNEYDVYWEIMNDVGVIVAEMYYDWYRGVNNSKNIVIVK